MNASFGRGGASVKQRLLQWPVIPSLVMGGSIRSVLRVNCPARKGPRVSKIVYLFVYIVVM